ncbi:isochorismatase [Indivirus ILV1]|uniref:nicotinamidase n=1 Tax=Indivirus ILV1 TaxID=1977633 RepID=A0A1V0SEH9_9VIRU|nr:isochorismatase [Indivirus ILV1]
MNPGMGVIHNMKNGALIIMDMQNDFCVGGPISHEKSLEIIPLINKLRDEFKYIFLTRKLYQENHSSFRNYGGKMHEHCVKDTYGSNFNPYLNITPNDMVITRGTLQKFDSNSAFYDADDIRKETNFHHLLQINGIHELYFCGIGMDSSIFATVLDAINLKYKCYVYQECVAYSNKSIYEKYTMYLESVGVKFI